VRGTIKSLCLYCRRVSHLLRSVNTSHRSPFNMDIVDRNIADAERDASPEGFPLSPNSHTTIRTTSSRTHPSSPDPQLRPHTARHESSLHRIELERNATYKLLHASTVGTQDGGRTRLQTLSTLGAGKPYSPSPYNVEDFLVEFEGPYDPLHPQNWPMRKRYYLRRISVRHVADNNSESSCLLYSPTILSLSLLQALSSPPQSQAYRAYPSTYLASQVALLFGDPCQNCQVEGYPCWLVCWDSVSSPLAALWPRTFRP
jgi:hypothetical protein